MDARSLILTALIVGFSQSAAAQGTASPATAALTDAQFVVRAIHGGHTDADAGKIGQGRAAIADVRVFAERMVAVHSETNGELGRLAAARQITFKQTCGGAPGLDIRADGLEFDRVFMQQMVRDHEKALELFEAESQNGKDAEIREWAASKLPALRDNLRVAREIYSKAYRLNYLATRHGRRGTR